MLSQPHMRGEVKVLIQGTVTAQHSDTRYSDETGLNKVLRSAEDILNSMAGAVASGRSRITAKIVLGDEIPATLG